MTTYIKKLEKEWADRNARAAARAKRVARAAKNLRAAITEVASRLEWDDHSGHATAQQAARELSRRHAAALVRVFKPVEQARAGLLAAREDAGLPVWAGYPARRVFTALPM